MNDLMQLNETDVTPQSKMATICPTAQMPKQVALKSKSHHQNTTSADNDKMATTNSQSMLHANHKRPSTLDTSMSKRLKSNSTVSSYTFDSSNPTSMLNTQQTYLLQNQEPAQLMASAQLINQQQEHQQQQQQKSPHLLQHLMAPTPTRARKYNNSPNKSVEMQSTNGQWNRSASGELKRGSLQSSDSVLKNLLVSGCDISAGYICQVPIRMKKLAKA